MRFFLAALYIWRRFTPAADTGNFEALDAGLKARSAPSLRSVAQGRLCSTPGDTYSRTTLGVPPQVLVLST